MDIDCRVDLLDAISLMSISDIHRELQIRDIDRLIAAPLSLAQYRIWREGSRPVAYVSWGYLSSEARDRHLARAGLVKAGDWNSGQELWFMDFIAPFGGITKYIRDLYRQFPDHKIAFISRSYGTGKVQRIGKYSHV